MLYRIANSAAVCVAMCVRVSVSPTPSTNTSIGGARVTLLCLRCAARDMLYPKTTRNAISPNDGSPCARTHTQKHTHTLHVFLSRFHVFRVRARVRIAAACTAGKKYDTRTRNVRYRRHDMPLNVHAAAAAVEARLYAGAHSRRQ